MPPGPGQRTRCRAYRLGGAGSGIITTKLRISDIMLKIHLNPSKTGSGGVDRPAVDSPDFADRRGLARSSSARRADKRAGHEFRLGEYVERDSSKSHGWGVEWSFRTTSYLVDNIYYVK